MGDNTETGDDMARAKRRQREALVGLIGANRRCDSGAVVAEVAAYLREMPCARTVAMFAALPGEVDLGGVPAMIDRIWVYPRVVGAELELREVRDFHKDLETGAYGIMEPMDGLRAVGIAEVDVFLCPGIGFDASGGRIGRGKGFYDRMLAHARPDALKVGVCFRHQLVDAVVTEPHDVRMDVVISR